jgi:hypothetical protein
MMWPAGPPFYDWLMLRAATGYLRERLRRRGELIPVGLAWSFLIITDKQGWFYKPAALNAVRQVGPADDEPGTFPLALRDLFADALLLAQRDQRAKLRLRVGGITDAQRLHFDRQRIDELIAPVGGQEYSGQCTARRRTDRVNPAFRPSHRTR